MIREEFFALPLGARIREPQPRGDWYRDGAVVNAIPYHDGTRLYITVAWDGGRGEEYFAVHATRSDSRIGRITLQPAPAPDGPFVRPHPRSVSAPDIQSLPAPVVDQPCRTYWECAECGGEDVRAYDRPGPCSECGKPRTRVMVREAVPTAPLSDPHAEIVTALLAQDEPCAAVAGRGRNEVLA
jgi:hypothetical protein